MRQSTTKKATSTLGWLWLAAALVAPALGGCATMGVNTRTLEQTPVVQAYEKLGNEAEETRSQAVGCPSCVY
ncbi:MAG: hypothetical protein ABI333_00335 [bacterium]